MPTHGVAVVCLFKASPPVVGGRKRRGRWKYQQSIRYRAEATAVMVEMTDAKKAQLKSNRTKGGGRGDRDKEVIKGLEIRK